MVLLLLALRPAVAPTGFLRPRRPRPGAPASAALLVDAALGQRRQLLVGRLLLVEGLLQQVGGVVVAHRLAPRRPACRRPPSRSARRAGRTAIRQASIVASSKSSSMTDLPSSMMPAMPSQCLPRTFSSRLANTCFEALDLPCGLLEMRLEGLPQLRRAGRLGQLRQRLDQLLLGVVGVAQLVDECVVQGSVSAMVVSPVSVLYRGRCHRVHGLRRAADRFRARSGDASRAPR